MPLALSEVGINTYFTVYQTWLQPNEQLRAPPRHPLTGMRSPIAISSIIFMSFIFILPIFPSPSRAGLNPSIVLWFGNSSLAGLHLRTTAIPDLVEAICT